jgi:hypothetical protein
MKPGKSLEPTAAEKASPEGKGALDFSRELRNWRPNPIPKAVGY